MPCDDEFGAHCPSESTSTVGACLRALPPSSVSAGCAEYLAVMEVCSEDLKTNCEGREAGEFTGEAMGCLTEWTSREALSEKCAAAIPAKKEGGAYKRERSEEGERKAARRKRKRDKAANLAKDQSGPERKEGQKKDEKKDEKKDKKKKKRKKNPRGEL